MKNDYGVNSSIVIKKINLNFDFLKYVPQFLCTAINVG